MSTPEFAHLEFDRLASLVYDLGMKTESDFQFTHGRDPEGVLSALVADGHSNTRARRAVIEALCRSDGRVGSAELLAEARRIHPGLGEVTVYRTLDLLIELGVVRRLHAEDGCHSYAVAAFDHGHHVICVRCQRAVEFEGCEIDSIVNAVESQTGFRVSEHWLEMFGLCPECQHLPAVEPAALNHHCG